MNEITEPIKESDFTVYSYSFVNKSDAMEYTHWATGLNMVITKKGITIELNEDEIIKLVACLPKTVSGSY